MTGTEMKIRANKFAADCSDCSTHIPAGAGRLVKAVDGWVVYCADAETCAATQAQTGSEPTKDEFDELVEAEWNRRMAAGENPNGFEVMADVQAMLRQRAQPQPTKRAAKRARRTSTSRRRKACVTGGNCSSHTGADCGGYDCDANGGAR